MKKAIFTFVAAMLITVMSYGQTKLSGTVVGTPDNMAGAGESIANLFDGDFHTFFDTNYKNKNLAWAGLDFGEDAQKMIDSLRFALRIPGGLSTVSDMRDRITGAKIYGANTLTPTFPSKKESNFDADTAGNLLYVIPASALESLDTLEYLTVILTQNTEKAFRYVVMDFAAGSNGNCSEFEVYGSDAIATAINTKKTTKSLTMRMFNDVLMVNSKVEEMATIQVYNLAGTLVAQQEKQLISGENTVSFSSPLARNLYVVRVQTGNTFVSQKMIVK